MANTDISKRTSFLNLPAELRLTIYDIYFWNSEHDVHYDVSTQRLHHPAISPLVMASKQVRKESLHRLFDQHTVPIMAVTLTKFLLRLDSTCLEKVRSLRIHTPLTVYCEGNGTFTVHPQLELQLGVLRALGSLTGNLRDLTLVFHGGVQEGEGYAPVQWPACHWLIPDCARTVKIMAAEWPSRFGGEEGDTGVTWWKHTIRPERTEEESITAWVQAG